MINEGKTGFLVAAGNVEALSQKISDAWTNPDLPAIGKAGRARVDDFRPEKSTEALSHYYRQILQA